MKLPRDLDGLALARGLGRVGYTIVGTRLNLGRDALLDRLKL